MLSVVLAAHNEEKNIAQCLKSVADFADEIIVVDGESTDATAEIAHNYGARVISTTNKKNFHINKQMAMDEAKGQLVLQMDADEAIDSQMGDWITELHQRIELLSKSELNEFQPKAWWLRRKNHFLGKWLKKGGQYPDPVIRLYINGYAKLPQKDVHEQMSVDGEIGWAEGHLLHYPNPTFADYLTNSVDRYSSLKADQLFDQGLKITPFSIFDYLLFKPLTTFFSLYVRHKGLVDGVPGLLFAVFSGLHFTFAYLKLWEKYENPS